MRQIKKLYYKIVKHIDEWILFATENPKQLPFMCSYYLPIDKERIQKAKERLKNE
jgi:hypothetical protein